MRIRRLFAVLMALSLSLVTMPVQANHLGPEDDPAVWDDHDSLRDGSINFCYTSSTYAERAMLNNAARLWNQAIPYTVVSLGRCDGGWDEDVRVTMADLGPCPTPPIGATLGRASGNHLIELNSRCKFWWGSSGPNIYGDNRAFAYSVMVHEVGHVFGLDHECTNGCNNHEDILDNPSVCTYGYSRQLSENDARSMRYVYRNYLPPTSHLHPLNAGCDYS